MSLQCPDSDPALLARVRATLNGIDGVVIPQTDAWQNEYVPAHNQRLAAVSGFTGSAGTAIITADKAVVFVDGRYTLQARQQVSDAWQIVDYPQTTPAGWLATHAGNLRIGINSWLVPEKTWQAYHKACPGMTLLTDDPVDAVWDTRPQPVHKPFFLHDLVYAGTTYTDKVTALTQAMTTDALLITDPASACWLLNLRGADVDYTPLALLRLIVAKTGQIWAFTAMACVGDTLRQHFGSQVIWQETASLIPHLTGHTGSIAYDPDACPVALVQAIGTKVAAPNPCLLAKACKNTVEQNGMRACHRRDGVAVTQILDWIQTNARLGTTTEADVAAQLLTFRQQQAHFVEPSFTTIAATGANGAIVHYHPTAQSNAILHQNQLFLLDSGGQYRDGTTDVTRTVWLGPDAPPPALIHQYTLVLKGHIMLAMARFPKGTTGAHLDALARYGLWQAGLDYAHGTGHGVGSFLSVHEGPQGISRGYGTTPLQPGMILSNEPGYYQPGSHGIRLENLVLVQECPRHTGFLIFETLTQVRFESCLIDLDLLDTPQREWLTAYHAGLDGVTTNSP